MTANPWRRARELVVSGRAARKGVQNDRPHLEKSCFLRSPFGYLFFTPLASVAEAYTAAGLG